MEDNYIEFDREWIELENYPFKILAVVTVLADNKKAFRGKISELCCEIGVGSSSVNLNKIKNSLAYLNESGYVHIVEDNGIYTVTLSTLAEKDKNIIKIKRAWYALIRKYHKENDTNCSWESILKVFLTIYEYNSEGIYTYKDIAAAVGFSERTVGNCVKCLEKIDFEDFRFCIDTIKIKDNNGEIVTLGRQYQKFIFFK